jgi:hypothetical protein
MNCEGARRWGDNVGELIFNTLIFVRLSNYIIIFNLQINILASPLTLINPCPPLYGGAAPVVGQSWKGHVTCTGTDRSSSLGGLHIRKGRFSNILFSSIDRFVGIY